MVFAITKFTAEYGHDDHTKLRKLATLHLYPELGTRNNCRDKSDSVLGPKNWHMPHYTAKYGAETSFGLRRANLLVY